MDLPSRQGTVCSSRTTLEPFPLCLIDTKTSPTMGHPELGTSELMPTQHDRCVLLPPMCQQMFVALALGARRHMQAASKMGIPQQVRFRTLALPESPSTLRGCHYCKGIHHKDQSRMKPRHHAVMRISIIGKCCSVTTTTKITP